MCQLRNFDSFYFCQTSFSCHLRSSHFTSLHFTSLHFTSPHLTSPHLTSPYSTPLHFTSFHFISLHFTSLRSASLHFTSPHLTSPHLTPLHSTPLHSTPLHFASFHFISLHFNSLHSAPLRFTSPHLTSPYSTPLHFTSLHSTSLHSTSLHFTSLHFTSARLHLCLPLSRNSFDGSQFQHADRHPRLCPFSSSPLHRNKTYYATDHTRPHVALNCARNCESCFAVSGTTAMSRLCALLVTAATYWHVFSVMTTAFFTRDWHLPLSWARRVQSTASHHLSVKYILILSSHLHLVFQVLYFLPLPPSNIHLNDISLSSKFLLCVVANSSAGSLIRALSAGGRRITGTALKCKQVWRCYNRCNWGQLQQHWSAD